MKISTDHIWGNVEEIVAELTIYRIKLLLMS